MSIITPELSKRVGWDSRTVNYPSSVEEVEGADHEMILTWYRFLKSPETPEQIKIMDAIVLKFKEE